MTNLRFRNTDTGADESHDVGWYREFLNVHVHEAGMQIGPHLDRIRGRPVFVVAATGVGKTVAVPVHLLLWLCNTLHAEGRGLDPMPCVIVVEPTIPICRSEADHMNSSFQAFLKQRALRATAHPFGAVTGPYKANANAPIRFVTTGVFEQMAQSIDPSRCRVVVDEAHRVLAQSPGVEIAACIARNRGVLVDWMSATVDTTELAARFGVDLVLATEQRYPIIKVPTRVPLDECIGRLVVQCLSRPDEIVPPPEAFRNETERRKCERTRQHLLSPTAFVDLFDMKRYPGLNERSQGMLVVVNSHQGENSDTRRVADAVQAACRLAQADIEVLRLASPVVRDVDQEAAFRRRVAGVESRRGRYVVIATNVVEMGVTFPSLDYVVTMDTELETTRTYGEASVQERPLGVNAFLQRIGRVGRRRPGMALLTREGSNGAAFSEWSPDDLAERLKLEPISFAVSRGDVRDLAFFLYQREVPPDSRITHDYLALGRMPSQPERDPQVLQAITREREAIKVAGLSDDGRRLNHRGSRFREIGVVTDLELGSLLAELASAGGALPYLALVTAANVGGLRDLLGRRSRLDDEQPALSQITPFARHLFKKPLDLCLTALRSGRLPMDPREIGTDESTAHHVSELLAEGYRVDEPKMVERDGKTEEPALITLSRIALTLDQVSELLAAYDIVRWFFRRYRADLADTKLADFERQRVRTALREEARLFGLNVARLASLMPRIEEIARRTRIDLGSTPGPSQLNDELLGQLAAVGARAQPDVTAEAMRDAIRVAHRNIARTQPTAVMPMPTARERQQFIESVGGLRLFTPVELSLSEDQRGNPVFVGEARYAGNMITVSIELGRTSLRPGHLARVRGRVVPIPYRNVDGSDAVRYSLSHVSIVG